MSVNPELTDGSNPSDLERDTDAIRANMNRTLDEIERKLSPGQLLDRSLGYLREHGSDIADKVGATVRDNPLPVLITAAGLLWTVTSMYRSARAGDERRIEGQDDYSSSAPDSGSDGADEAMREKLKSSAASAKERVLSTGQAVADRARETTRTATGTVKHAMHSTREQTQRARQGFRQMVDEQPMALGAIGIAIGAILGAALPTTEWENRVMGQARNRALTKAKELGEQKYDDLRETIRGSATMPESSAAH